MPSLKLHKASRHNHNTSTAFVSRLVYSCLFLLPQLHSCLRLRELEHGSDGVGGRAVGQLDGGDHRPPGEVCSTTKDHNKQIPANQQNLIHVASKATSRRRRDSSAPRFLILSQTRLTGALMTVLSRTWVGREPTDCWRARTGEAMAAGNELLLRVTGIVRKLVGEEKYPKAIAGERCNG